MTNRMSKVPVRRVWIWDSNPFNPYAAEVARVIARDHHTTRFCRAGDQVAAEAVKVKRWLPRPSGGKPTPAAVLRTFIALLLFVLGAILLRRVVVIPWIEKHEEFFMLVLAVIGRRLIVVVHNPVESRDVGGGLVSIVRRRSRVLIVHSQRLVPFLSGHQVHVATHPAYTAWANRMSSMYGELAPDGRSVLYFGAARADKGFDLLPALDRNYKVLGVPFIVCVGRVAAGYREVLDHVQFAERVGDGNSYVSDEDAWRAFGRAGVLIAPYSEVTVSGTVIMALTLGLPVVAFRSDGMEELLGPEDMVESGDVQNLAERSATALLSADRPSRGEALDARSAREWSRVIRSI